jgi:3D (Asp-Asp-Asp) domain-containing protein
MKRKIAICVLTSVLASGAALASDWHYVTADLLNVREKPSTQSDVLDIVPYGTAVAFADDDPDLGGWVRIRVTDYIDGYVKRSYLASENPLERFEYLGEWRVTAYAETGMPCANGNYPTTGYTIACNSLPFGTTVYIEGVGFRTVEDRGPEWLGAEWCDLYLGEYTDCVQWGDQMRKVWRATE